MTGAVFPAAVVAAVVFTAFAGAAIVAAPGNTTAPTVSGTAKVGQTLMASDGTWSNTPTSYAYQWLRCNGGGNSCVNVANGTQKSYTLVGVDAGHTMRVRVTATNADGSASAQSDQTSAVEPATSSAAPKNTSTPTISGTPKVGQTLTADNGSWTGSPTTYAYAWQRCDADIASCANVVGATGKTYGVRVDDLGYRLRVSVTARNAKGTGTANLGDHGHRSACGANHERQADDPDRLDPLSRPDRLRAGSDLRRLVQERDDPRDRLATRRRLIHAAVHDARCTEAVRCVHASLDSGGPLPWPREVHGDPESTRQVRPHQRAGQADFQPLEHP